MKLSDFGFSIDMNGVDKSSKQAYYSSADHKAHNVYKSDVYLLGLTILYNRSLEPSDRLVHTDTVLR